MEGTAPIRYFDRDFQIEAVKILPGQYYAATGHGAITTVLGSCVSTCLWDPLKRIGGMNHFMLPGDGESASSPVTASARFGVYAMEVLIVAAWSRRSSAAAACCRDSVRSTWGPRTASS
jgi:chemotaxis protein CheD